MKANDTPKQLEKHFDESEEECQRKKNTKRKIQRKWNDSQEITKIYSEKWLNLKTKLNEVTVPKNPRIT